MIDTLPQTPMSPGEAEYVVPGLDKETAELGNNGSGLQDEELRRFNFIFLDDDNDPSTLEPTQHGGQLNNTVAEHSTMKVCWNKLKESRNLRRLQR